jgi:2-polyprenyl-3-methyl-5-hydroxy-6-metoxy-1,4-benzoquinol methylase
MYSDVFCKVYNEFGWNYYQEAFGEQLLVWLRRRGVSPCTSLDLACGTGILCGILHRQGIQARGMDFSGGMIDIARESEPEIPFEVADMITYRPDLQFDLVTCTGDALNHISDPADVARILENVYGYLRPGGYFVFDILNENEVSASDPFEMDFSDTVRVWFQMTRPEAQTVCLTIRVYQQGELQFEETIRETIHDPQMVCGLLEQCGFEVLQCADRLLEDSHPGTTWFVAARKPLS